MHLAAHIVLSGTDRHHLRTGLPLGVLTLRHLEYHGKSILLSGVSQQPLALQFLLDLLLQHGIKVLLGLLFILLVRIPLNHFLNDLLL